MAARLKIRMAWCGETRANAISPAKSSTRLRPSSESRQQGPGYDKRAKSDGHTPPQKSDGFRQHGLAHQFVAHLWVEAVTVRVTISNCSPNPIVMSC